MSKRKKRKNKNYIIFLIIITLLLGGYLGYIKYKEINNVNVKLKDTLNAEINSEVKLLDFVDDVKNGEVTNGSDFIDTSKLGKKKCELIIKGKDSKEEKYGFEINIIDETKPVIEAKGEITSYVGRDVNLLNGVVVSDNSNEEINAKVVGEYDLNKTGKYELKYTASDSSGNMAEYDFILNIISDNRNRVFTTSKGFLGKVVDGVTYIDGVLIANKTYNLPSNYGSGLTSETTNAFNKMRDDASKEGYNLYIASGYRSYNTQKNLYNNYVNRDGQAAADTYSARAGHSEHQTGLAFDVCDRNVSACINSYFDSSAQAKWMSENCYKYGLILRYPKNKQNETGYMYESWHFRYVGVELATKLYDNGNWMTMEEYYGIDSKYS